MQERLWAPWRMQYVSTAGKPSAECIFCAKPAEQNDAENLIVWRSIHCYVILNLFPYTSGHLMIAQIISLCVLGIVAAGLFERVYHLLERRRGHCRKCLKD